MFKQSIFLDSVRDISQRFTVPYYIGGGAEPVLNHTEICPARKFKIDPCVEMTEYEVIYVLTLPKRFGKFVEDHDGLKHRRTRHSTIVARPDDVDFAGTYQRKKMVGDTGGSVKSPAVAGQFIPAQKSEHRIFLSPYIPLFRLILRGIVPDVTVGGLRRDYVTDRLPDFGVKPGIPGVTIRPDCPERPFPQNSLFHFQLSTLWRNGSTISSTSCSITRCRKQSSILPPTYSPILTEVTVIPPSPFDALPFPAKHSPHPKISATRLINKMEYLRIIDSILYYSISHQFHAVRDGRKITPRKLSDSRNRGDMPRLSSP